MGELEDGLGKEGRVFRSCDCGGIFCNSLFVVFDMDVYRRIMEFTHSLESLTGGTT